MRLGEDYQQGLVDGLEFVRTCALSLGVRVTTFNDLDLLPNIKSSPVRQEIEPHTIIHAGR